MKSILARLLLLLPLIGYRAAKDLQHQTPGAAAAGLERIAVDYADTSTLNGRWFLQAVLPSDTATGKIPNISFMVKQYRFTGNTGCNTMSGTFKLSGKSLQFDSNIVRTKKACTGYNEAAFIQSLLHTNNYKFESGMLILLFDATELSRWARQPKPPQKTNRA